MLVKSKFEKDHLLVELILYENNIQLMDPIIKELIDYFHNLDGLLKPPLMVLIKIPHKVKCSVQ